jgi:hypothetical protein
MVPGLPPMRWRVAGPTSSTMSSTAPSLHFEVLRSGRFDGHLDDLFSLQHRIAFDMVTQVDPDLFHHGADSEVSVRTMVAEAHGGGGTGD